jgi:hypothetical protein
MPNRESRHFWRLFRLQFQVSRGQRTRKPLKSRDNALLGKLFKINMSCDGGVEG